MRFTIKRDEFLKGLLIAGRATATKSLEMPILNNLKIELNDNGLFITGSNLDLTIKTLIPFTKSGNEIIRNHREGAVLINSKFLTELVRKMDSDEVTLDVVDSTIAVLSDSRSKYDLNCIRSEEYPDLDLDPNGVELTINKADLSAIVNQTAFAASTKETNPILTSINLEAGNGTLTAIALDASRLALKKISVDNDVSFIANIPAKTLIEIDHLTDGVNTIDISISDKKALFTFNGTIAATRLLAGKYPNTAGVFPKTTNYVLQVNAKEFLKAIDRANVLNPDQNAGVELIMGDDGVQIAVKNSQVGSAVENIENYKFEGGNLQIAFNSLFVVEAVRAIGSEDVTLSFVGDLKPFTIKNEEDSSVIQVCTSMRHK